MTGELNWIFWTLGGSLGLGGLCLLYWSLFADRSKGRKRCPKCWYNMSHTPSLTCSECGHTAKREKKLCKTRRRWRWAVVAILTLIGSASSSLAPKVKRDGWFSMMPTTVLILLVSEHDDQQTLDWRIIAYGNWPKSNKPTEELGKRIKKGHLSAWQWRLLANQLHPGNDASWIIDFSAREQWPVGEPFYATIKLNVHLQNHYWLGSSELRIKVNANLPNAQTWSDEIYTDIGIFNFGERYKRPIEYYDKTTLKWIEPSRLMGIVPEGVQVVTLNVTLERRDDSYDDDKPWTILWEGEYKHDLDVHGSVDDILEPIGSQSLKALSHRTQLR